MKSNRLTRLIVGLALFLLIFGPLLGSAIDLLVDWLWFRQEGFGVIYLTIIKSQIGLSSVASLVLMALVTANLLIARRFSERPRVRIDLEVIEFPALDRFSRLFRGLVWLGVLLVGYMVGQWATAHWFDYLLASRAVRLGEADPLFGIDLGFYLFRLPFWWFVYYFALLTLIACLLGATFMYLVEGGISVSQRGASIGRAPRAHLMVLGGLFFVLFAYRVRLGMYDLLYSQHGLFYGAGYTDVNATLPVLRILLLLCLVTAVAFAWGAQRRSLRPPIFAIIVLVAVWVVGGAIYPEIIQRFIVAPNEIERERPYIARAVEFTRKAYALDRFEEREFSDVEDLTLNDIRQNEATIRNIRLWDHQPLKTTFSQLQEIRTYYDFVRVDNDRYGIYTGQEEPGRTLINRQVSLSSRELNSASLPSRNWINEHLTYTHGYGLCMGPVNESTPDGLPEFFIKNIPPVSTTSIKVTRPEIYYGESANDYCFVNTRLKEFDYPAGDQNVYTSYAGAGGLPVEGFWRRLLFALKFGEKNILFSGDITPESRLMIYRRVLERAGRLTPFLRYDHDPYMVIAEDGALYWMLDGYTISEQYPYSEPYGELGNYIRNSVKATINAYTGQVRFYISDPSDPLIQAYARLFPGVFAVLEAMPRDLRAHIRYPEDFFSVQASKYAVFHMTDPRVFYNREDLWRVAQSAARGSAAPMTPYYTIMKLAEVGTSEEFILMVPFTPAKKDNMIAWIAARCDVPNYGKVLVFTFPKQKLVYGPQQIESRIDQETGISQQLTLWDQGGSKVIRGTLLVIPVRNSVLYVEPLYLAAEAGGGLPQLKRVIVAYADNVVMEATLDAALGRIFGGAAEAARGQNVAAPAGPVPPQAPVADGQSLIREASQHFERAQQLLKQGDWSGYGEEMKKVGEILKRLSNSGASGPHP